jgi:hypothetical protein
MRRQRHSKNPLEILSPVQPGFLLPPSSTLSPPSHMQLKSSLVHTPERLCPHHDASVCYIILTSRDIQMKIYLKRGVKLLMSQCESPRSSLVAIVPLQNLVFLILLFLHHSDPFCSTVASLTPQILSYRHQEWSRTRRTTKGPAGTTVLLPPPNICPR